MKQKWRKTSLNYSHAHSNSVAKVVLFPIVSVCVSVCVCLTKR